MYKWINLCCFSPVLSQVTCPKLCYCTWNVLHLSIILNMFWSGFYILLLFHRFSEHDDLYPAMKNVWILQLVKNKENFPKMKLANNFSLYNPIFVNTVATYPREYTISKIQGPKKTFWVDTLIVRRNPCDCISFSIEKDYASSDHPCEKE